MTFFDSYKRASRAQYQAWYAIGQAAVAIAAAPALAALELACQAVGVAPSQPQAPTDAPPASMQARAEAAEARVRELAALVDELRDAYQRLERGQDERLAGHRADQRAALFQTLEPLLIQLPVVRHAIAEGREVATADLLALLGPLDALGFEAIGEVGSDLGFDPALHQMASGAAPDAGAPVTVRYVGFRLGERILRRAQVTLKKAATVVEA